MVSDADSEEDGAEVEVEADGADTVEDAEVPPEPAELSAAVLVVVEVAVAVVAEVAAVVRGAAAGSFPAASSFPLCFSLRKNDMQLAARLASPRNNLPHRIPHSIHTR